MTRTSAIPLLCGPTAVGKTAVSIEVASRTPVEVLSADARQVYRRLDIGTAKPSANELSHVRHHLLDELEPHEHFSAGEFARLAEKRIDDILTRGLTPLVVGGSTLYIEALVNGLAEIPRVDQNIRTELTRRLEHEGISTLWSELKTADPAAAATMDETKSQRIVRALEVYLGTGRPISSFHRSRTTTKFQYAGVVLTRPREELYTRIDARVDSMLSRGLIREVEQILASGLNRSSNALQTLGYKEVISYLDREISYEELARMLKRNTRRYAKRQLTWFRRYTSFPRVSADARVEQIRMALGLKPPGQQ